MRMIIALGLALASNQMSAMTLNCSSSDGDVTVSVFRHDGGGTIPQGTEILRETWNYKGERVGGKSHVEGAPSGAIVGRIGSFNEQMRVPVDLSKVGQKPVGEAVYAIQVIAPTHPTSDHTVTLFVICNQAFPTVPYPL